ncbi:MAG TPA: tetratricopeptide repeat protein [Solirubrobacterales bacterium]|nr:tetratricopeptide repeat protein [Solirubrobacterales bacterium]
MAEGNGDLKHMTAHEFVRRLRSHADETDHHYTFWLGAGCSVTSGVPAAAALVRERWLPQLHEFKGRHERTVEEWAKATFPSYDPDDLAALYGPVMEELFPLKHEKQGETERLCEKAAPGFGYAVLAALMSRDDGVFSGALTTNFDDLVADSMYVYGDRRPLVIQHNALAGFVRPGMVRRPLVVKVHGDHRLNPMHTSEETADLEEGIRRGVQGLLRDRGVIFIGYAGNDSGVLKALEGLPDDAIPLGVWWVSRREPQSAIRPWLESRKATWVQADGFDELMLLFREGFEIDHPTAQKFERMISRYRETYEELGSRIQDLPETAPDSVALKEAARSARETASDWWGFELEARQFKNEDPARADEIYRDGIAQLEDPRLMANYALFLDQTRKDYDRAEEYYERALEIEPENPINLGNYAIFLQGIRKDYDRAGEYYERALEIDPEKPTNLGNYAFFLKNIRKDYDRAEEYYERALAAEPEDATNLNNYAAFLRDVRNDDDRAEGYYERALAADPDHANALGGYALFLQAISKDYDRAEEYYERAIKADPENPINLGNYATFLHHFRKDFDRAEEYYERSIEAGPEVATHLGNYAFFLKNIRKDNDRAEGYYERAFEIQPEVANNLGNYGQLKLERKDDAGFELVEKALRLADPASEAPLLVELWFYLLALGNEERSKEALPELIRLIGEGARSPGWDLSGILRRARDMERPDIEWLERLADVIADRAGPEVLEGWSKWTSAEG